MTGQAASALRWFTSGFNQHLSWKLTIPSGWSRTTARSTRCAATSTGWHGSVRLVPCSATTSISSGRFPMKAIDTACFDNASNSGDGARLAHAADVIPGAWAAIRSWIAPPRLLRVSRRPPHGRGRPGCRRLHRWSADWRHVDRTVRPARYLVTKDDRDHVVRGRRADSEDQIVSAAAAASKCRSPISSRAALSPTMN